MLELDGAKYRFAQIGLAMGLKATTPYRERQKEVFSEAVELAKGLDVEVSRELVLEAFRDLSAGQKATQQQVFEWLATPEGNLWQFTTSLRAVNKQMTDEECEELYGVISPQQWKDFDDFQSEPFRNSMADTVRLRAELARAMKAINSEVTDELCEVVFGQLNG